MTILMLKKPFLTLAMVLFCMSPGIFANEAVTPSKARGAVIERVIGEIANFNTFRISSKSLELIFSKHCKQINTSKDQDAVFQSYHCEDHTGIQMIDMISMEPQGGQNHLLELKIKFSYNSYPLIHKVVMGNLGKPSRKMADFIEWRNTRDSSLNKLGNPVINISRNKAKGSGRLIFALEQGDS